MVTCNLMRRKKCCHSVVDAAEISAGSFGQCPAAGVNFPGDTPSQEANGDVLLDGVAFSIELLE